MGTIKLFELKKIQTEFPSEKITSPDQAANFIRRFYFDDMEIFESFFILLLNQGNKTIGYAKISQGGISGTVVDVRIIAKYAIEALATSVILAHNHPSGNLTPSQADITITEKIKAGLKILDIKVFDHIILTADSFYSMENNNEI